MPIYEFMCEKCKQCFETLTSYNEFGEYPDVVCTSCGGHDNKKLPSKFAFNFSNPNNTDRWNSDSYGHDYRFKSKIVEKQAERSAAELASHMGTQPYTPIDDTVAYDTGIHDR